MAKRTKQIDDSREVELKRLGKINGKPVFSTMGQLEMTGADKEGLSSNIKDSQLQGRVNNTVGLVYENAARFASKVFTDIAPAYVIEAEQKSLTERRSQKIIVDWMRKSNFKVIQDGLKTVITVRGKIVAEITADISDDIRRYVEVRIKQENA